MQAGGSTGTVGGTTAVGNQETKGNQGERMVDWHLTDTPTWDTPTCGHAHTHAE